MDLVFLLVLAVFISGTFYNAYKNENPPRNKNKDRNMDSNKALSNPFEDRRILFIRKFYDEETLIRNRQNEFLKSTPKKNLKTFSPRQSGFKN